MERLTFLNGDGIPCVRDDQCYEEQSGHYCGPAIDRLADYEDLGMLAEEIVDTVQQETAQFDVMREMQIVAALKQLNAYKQAEKDGHLVALPCKVGDTVWAIENPWTGKLLKKPIEAYVNGMKKFSHGLYVNVLFDTRKINGTRDYEANHIGETIFLTREEAEKALEAMKDG